MERPKAVSGAPMGIWGRCNLPSVRDRVKVLTFYMQICTFWCSLASFVQHFGRGDEKITLVPELYWGITPRPFGASSQCRVRRLCPWKILEILHANLSILLSFWHFCQFFWWGEKISYPSIFYWGAITSSPPAIDRFACKLPLTVYVLVYSVSGNCV